MLLLSLFLIVAAFVAGLVVGWLACVRLSSRHPVARRHLFHAMTRARTEEVLSDVFGSAPGLTREERTGLLRHMLGRLEERWRTEADPYEVWFESADPVLEEHARQLIQQTRAAGLTGDLRQWDA